MASTHRKPSSNYDETIGQILQNSGIGQALQTTADFRFKNFKSTQVNHLYAIEEGLKVVLWPTTNTTISYVKVCFNYFNIKYLIFGFHSSQIYFSLLSILSIYVNDFVEYWIYI